ncbi:MAG: PKD domain-containing protein [Candidatus Marinimicrobia bacterium]|nr:PKD domain-containing protein [Candidatus Neomarinimicrobiota bacterium]
MLKQTLKSISIFAIAILVISQTTFAQFSENVTVVSKTIYGDYKTVFTSGNYTYFSREEVFGILDVSDPTSPSLVSEYAVFFDESIYFEIYDIHVLGDYAYLATSDSLRILDISVPSAPVQAGSYWLNYYTSVTVSGNYAYIAGSWGGSVRVLDISDPSSPSQVASFSPPSWSSGYFIHAKKVHIENNYAYVAYAHIEDYWMGVEENGGIGIFDITTPSSPTQVGGYEIVQDWYTPADIDVWGNYAYQLSSNELRVFDISNLTNPTQVSTVLGGINMDISSSYAYLTTSGPSQLKVLSLSYPSSPVEVASIDVVGYPSDIHVEGDYAHLAQWQAGVHIVDISTPSSPTEAGVFDTHTNLRDVHVSGNNAYLEMDNNGDPPAGVQVLDISDPSGPVEIGFMEEQSIGKIYSNYAIERVGYDFRITDISDPSAPIEIASFNHENTGFGDFHISNNYIYARYNKIYPVTGEGIAIIDISNPVAPRLVSELELEINQYNKPLYAYNNRVYLYDEIWDGQTTSLLRIIDVSDRRSPAQIGLFTFPENVEIANIIVVDDYAYLFESSANNSGREAMHIVDVSDPSAPAFISTFNDFGLNDTWSFSIYDVAIYNDYAYLTTGLDSLGLAVVDIGDPTSPSLTGFYAPYMEPNKIQISSNYIYSITGENFTILQNDLTSEFSTDFMADIMAGSVPLTVQFTDLSEGQPSSWAWDFDSDGTIDSQERSPIHTYNVTGDYTVSLTVSDGTNTLTETKDNYIATESFLEAHFSADNTIGTKPLTVHFSDSSIALQTSATSWAWDFNDDGINDSDDQNPIWTYDEAGKYTVSLAISDGIKTDTLTKEDYIIVTHFDEHKLTAGDAEIGDYFGYSASISGNYAIVGANNDDDNGSNSGSAYIFYHAGEGWIEQSKLTASDGAYSNRFGQSVSISGEYAIVGAPFNQNNGISTGSAYIFKRMGTAWEQQAKIFPGDGDYSDAFGYSVSINGEYAIIGAYADDDSGSSSGSAYIFKRDGTVWSEQIKLTASDAEEQDWFGYSVSVSGEHAIVGAYKNDDSGESSGSAYIFKLEGETWTEISKLTPNDPDGGDKFGYSVSIKGNDAIIGTPQSDDSGNASGSAYIYSLEGEDWIQQDKLTASDGAASDQMGFSVAIKRDYAIVGAQFTDDNGYSSGSAYLFRRDQESWIQEVEITASDGVAYDQLGASVAISGRNLLLGALGDDDSGESSGSAYVYRFAATGLFADFSADVFSGFAPLAVQFSDLSEGSPTSWEWDFDNDGTIDSEDQNPLWTYMEPGLYDVTLTIFDSVSSLSVTKENYISILASEIPEPAITSIDDVPEDQGGKVFLSFTASSLDIEGFITQYGIWSMDAEGEWFSLGIIPSIPGNGGYTFLATTLGDSSNSGTYWSWFQITAHTSDPYEYYISEIDSGYSVDNLSPAVPTGLLASVTEENTVELNWDSPVDEDFNYFRIYRSLTPDFDPSGMEPISESIDPTFIDSDVETGETYYYRLSAIDFHGNESEYSEAVGATVLSTVDESGIPLEFGLRQNYPNPFNPITHLRYDLPEQAFVNLTIYDLLGRQVTTLVNQVEEAGYRSVTWNATDTNGKIVSAGMYLYIIKTGDPSSSSGHSFVQTRKMILLK